MGATVHRTDGDEMGTVRRWTWIGLMGLGFLPVWGCERLLEVENPNQLVQEDLEKPAAAAALVNGALATVARSFGYFMLLSGIASDELRFVGSRDAWLQLQTGDLRDPNNEFSDEAWPFIAEGRWMADEAVRLLTGFQQAGTLSDRKLLAWARLYSAVQYTMIADLFEDFPLSDRKNAAPPLGPQNMIQMYDRALQNLGEALSIAEASGDNTLRATILAQRARTRHARAVWRKLNPPGTVPAEPLIDDPAMVADAQAALSLVGLNNDWKYRFTYSSSTVANNWGAWVNERLELRFSNAYVRPTSDDKKVAAVTLADPITGQPSPAAAAIINEAVTTRQYGPITVVSARELHLLLAEASLAANDLAGFTTHINRLRALDGLPPYAGQVPARDLLIHSRQANLLYQGRRLNDHYRFGIPSYQWLDGKEAKARPGTKFPITFVERTSNCHIAGKC